MRDLAELIWVEVRIKQTPQGIVWGVPHDIDHTGMRQAEFSFDKADNAAPVGTHVKFGSAMIEVIPDLTESGSHRRP